MDNRKPKTTTKRIGGYLHRVVPVLDSAGKLLQFAVTPLMVEFRPRDLMQVIVGASVLAVPVAFTEETWTLGESLPFINVLLLSCISLLFIGGFVYFNFYRYMLQDHLFDYFKRTLSIYLFSLFVVSVILTLIQKCPWGTDNLLAVKRIMIVSFPASMSAAISDTIK